ncbi:winged helix-turn-helix domain-containing protein [Chengkuizengella axinellae]|uniref:Winged helix-turn-helix domain-containing protein n=1 Tax=Chengkuizengella axinellae TaxID=3064388 RepID=A0ABT9ITV0_9BACL|nr:winged helix-turn-helix domain-containing protein [Chengkuizengella sp. 2205SS18-9]MDP5272786.1 winged helix-turn-helix domain-containing protein [Chengkuizengella sp. 2205SS18-9]
MVEDKLDSLFPIQKELIDENNLPEVIKIINETLYSYEEVPIQLVKRLYDLIATIKETTIQLALYQVIIDYSRTHGIIPYIAKGLLQKYLIERDDFTKFHSTYASGKGILFFEDFLTSEEKGLVYYKLGVHAYYLCLFEESIKLGEKALDASITDARMQANTIYLLCNSYYQLGDYEQTVEYLVQYRAFSLPEVNDNVNLTEAMLHSANGNYQLAISMLQKNLQQCGDYTLLHVVNHLITLYLQTENLSAIEEIIQKDEKLLSIPKDTPFKKARLAHYFRLKGDYFIHIEKIEDGMKYYLEAATGYAKVDLIEKESECFRLIRGTEAICKLRGQNSTFLKDSYTHNLISPLTNYTSSYDNTNQHQQNLNSDSNHCIYLGHETYLHTLELYIQDEKSTRNLSNREYELLNLLIKHEGHIIHKSQIISSIWNDTADEGSVSVLMTRLRKKLGKAAKTIQGRKQGGYIFKRIEVPNETI